MRVEELSAPQSCDHGLGRLQRPIDQFMRFALDDGVGFMDAALLKGVQVTRVKQDLPA